MSEQHTIGDFACDHDAGFRSCGCCSLCGNRVWWHECDRRGLPRDWKKYEKASWYKRCKFAEPREEAKERGQ